MLTTRADQSLIVRFAVQNAGALVTGLASGAFTVSVVSPGNTALSPVPTVSESTKAGVYQFTVPSSFWAAGAGQYIYVVEVGAPGPTQVYSDTIDVKDDAGRLELSVTFDAAANTLRMHTWLMRGLGQVTTGLTNATLRLYDRTGTALTALQTTASPDAQGAFAFNVAAPAFPVGETETYFVLTVADAGPPARTWRGMVGGTFTRTS